MTALLDINPVLLWVLIVAVFGAAWSWFAEWRDRRPQRSSIVDALEAEREAQP